MYKFFFLLSAAIFFCVVTFGQNFEKIVYDKADSTNACYLAIKPQSGRIRGAILLITSFTAPENLLTETKLGNVASANDFLFIVCYTNQKLYADQYSVNKINFVLNDIAQRFICNRNKFIIGGYDEAGNIALRYTEMVIQNPNQYEIIPKAVFAIDSHVDLFGLWKWSENQVKKNYWPGAVGDAAFYLNAMTKENGSIYQNMDKYKKLTPFYRENDAMGNERFLQGIPVRLYYDNDINWQLKNRRNSYYDTKMPDGSEMIKRLLLSGNNEAEFIASKQQGIKSNGIRHPNSISIVEEVDFIQWAKKCLLIYDEATWTSPYYLKTPIKWTEERFSLPPDFAADITYNGIEELRFPAGWGDINSPDYWSYGYLWWLEGNPNITAQTLEQNLNLLYSGLVGRNIVNRKIPTEKIVPTRVSIQKTTKEKGDLYTFIGKINILDYIAVKPILLNAKIHLKECIEQKRTAVIFEISPKEMTHPIWINLNSIVTDFRCTK